MSVITVLFKFSFYYLMYFQISIPFSFNILMFVLSVFIFVYLLGIRTPLLPGLIIISFLLFSITFLFYSLKPNTKTSPVTKN